MSVTPYPATRERAGGTTRGIVSCAAALALALGLTLLMPATISGAADKNVTLDAEDAYLPTVLKILAEKGDLNIVTGPGVTAGRLSIHMKDVPIDQAVNLVVRAAGLAYERIGNSILVADAKSLKDETGLSSYVVDLKYADARDVQAAIKNLADQVQIDPGTNRLIVVTSPRVIAEIRNIVQTLDVPARQVMLEARVVEVSTDDTKRLGIDWEQLSRQGVVFVEGNYDSSFGSGSQLSNLKVFKNTPGTHDIFKLNNFTRDAQVYRLAIDLLIRNGNARVLANPKIAVLNGREASILIGSRIPYTVSGTIFAGGAAAPTQTIQREEVGIKLRITPLINADGYITTTINPEVSSVIGFQGVNSDLPVVATRQASTTVRLKDGNSVIIGGLLSEEKTTTVTKLPILGSIPVLGYLFQHQSIVTSKKDLVIEVTPRILAEQQ
jgi:type IV pilus secretin PilQ/predicted competence protein